MRILLLLLCGLSAWAETVEYATFDITDDATKDTKEHPATIDLVVNFDEAGGRIFHFYKQYELRQAGGLAGDKLQGECLESAAVQYPEMLNVLIRAKSLPSSFEQAMLNIFGASGWNVYDVRESSVYITPEIYQHQRIFRMKRAKK